MKKYTFVQVDHGNGERAEALYADGRLILESDGTTPLTAEQTLEAIAMDTIAVNPTFKQVTTDYDDSVLAMEGWPEHLDELPAEAFKES